MKLVLSLAFHTFIYFHSWMMMNVDSFHCRSHFPRKRDRRLVDWDLRVSLDVSDHPERNDRCESLPLHLPPKNCMLDARRHTEEIHSMTSSRPRRTRLATLRGGYEGLRSLRIDGDGWKLTVREYFRPSFDLSGSFWLSTRAVVSSAWGVDGSGIFPLAERDVSDDGEPIRLLFTLNGRRRRWRARLLAWSGSCSSGSLLDDLRCT